jgi:hypothetical protein
MIPPPVPITQRLIFLLTTPTSTGPGQKSFTQRHNRKSRYFRQSRLPIPLEEAATSSGVNFLGGRGNVD